MNRIISPNYEIEDIRFADDFMRSGVLIGSAPDKNPADDSWSGNADISYPSFPASVANGVLDFPGSDPTDQVNIGVGGVINAVKMNIGRNNDNSQNIDVYMGVSDAASRTGKLTNNTFTGVGIGLRTETNGTDIAVRVRTYLAGVVTTHQTFSEYLLLPAASRFVNVIRSATSFTQVYFSFDKKTRESIVRINSVENRVVIPQVNFDSLDFSGTRLFISGSANTNGVNLANLRVY